tara:strand:- start:2038 stop:2292 length:255 start_codon:yes stop_codon:yes gene_type:complete
MESALASFSQARFTPLTAHSAPLLSGAAATIASTLSAKSSGSRSSIVAEKWLTYYVWYLYFSIDYPGKSHPKISKMAPQATAGL